MYNYAKASEVGMNMDHHKRIEEYTLNAWPSLQTVVHDGWIIRFAEGYSKRANSVSPLYDGSGSTLCKRLYCEALYAERKLPTVFKMTPFNLPSTLDEELAQSGYSIVEPSRVKVCSLEEVEVPAYLCSGSVYLQTEMTQGWLKALGQITGLSDEKVAIQEKIISNIQTKTVFALYYVADRPVACGLGVLQDEYISLYDIVTEPAYRQRGYAKQVIQHILQWGRSNGASHSYLQVVQSNEPANKLYSSLGYKHLYPYWYRVKLFV
jgi:RimJ/RimL family protein N-acetyltransferase